MKHLFTLVVLCLTVSSAQGQATYTAASCNNTSIGPNLAVQTAVNLATNPGDTVIIPAGTCTWDTAVTVTVAINLLGSGQGTTTIIDNVDKTTCAVHPIIFMNISATSAWRLAKFTVRGLTLDSLICAEHIEVITNSHSLRIDDILFDDNTNNVRTTEIGISGDAWGVVDHITVNGAFSRGVWVHGDNWLGVGAFGDNSWAQSDSMGAAGTVANPSTPGAGIFVEDSTFNVTGAVSTGSMACEDGARCIARHNRLQFLGTHGLDTGGRTRSVRHFEAYNNTFTDQGTVVNNAMLMRGGTAIFFNNNIAAGQQGASYVNPVRLQVYAESDQFRPWGLASNPGIAYAGACDGARQWDKNDGTVYATGTATATCDGSNSCTDLLTDSGATWTTSPSQWAKAPDQWYSLYNATSQTWGASIQSNTATTITTYARTQGGQDHTWATGNTYQVLKVYPCMDQPGRGQGDVIAGGSATTPPTTPVTPTWPHQAVDPIYAWGNTNNNVAMNGVVLAAYTHVQPNRDFYDQSTGSFTGATGTGSGMLATLSAVQAAFPACTPLVAYWSTVTQTLYQCATPNTWTIYYRPFTYPHPLQHVPPTAPTNLYAVSH